MTPRRVPSLNLPNQLTLLRLGMCGLLLISMSIAWRWAATTALIIFALASLTDWLDGSIARSRNLVTDLGKLLDPLADKVLITGTLVSLVGLHIAPMWMVVVIITREFLITGLRTIAAHKNIILAAERIGKHKTISQIVVILVSLSGLSLAEFGLGNSWLARLLGDVQPWLYWVALIITVYSGAVYFWRNAAVLRDTMADPPEVPASSPVVKSVEPLPAPPAKAGGTPAFKEWEGIVEALGHGAQIILLRKGGIAEGRAGFQMKHDRFWLFPTRFHQQWDRTRAELKQFVPSGAEERKDFKLEYFVEVSDSLYLDQWEQVENLKPFHFWSEETLRERFGYEEKPGMQPGLHLVVVRVHRVSLAHTLKPAPEFEGCKSWIEVPVDWAQDISFPVVQNEEFATRRSQILGAVQRQRV